MVSPPPPTVTLVDAIDHLLPQTQCRRCGYDDCRAYAQAIARGETGINRCPPGADATIQALARLLDQPPVALADDLQPMPVRHVVRIDPAHCIGCTKCILACPVDAIVGAPRFQHQILTERCTGCELCLPPCPTDCISLVALASAWQDSDARHGRRNHQRRDQRLQASRNAAQTPSQPVHAAADPGGSPRPLRDPNIALASMDEKARRLAAIRARLKPVSPQTVSE